MDKLTGNSGPAMTTADLGEINEPLLVCGGAYGNLQALTALLAAASAHGIPANRIIHTGDAVAYCGDPEATTVLLRQFGMPAIQGNVEESLSAGMADCGCGFEPGSACDRLSEQWFAFADVNMSVESRQWMGSLPHHLIFTMAGRRVRVVHGSVREINRFVFESSPESEYLDEFDWCGADIVVAGHSGIPFTRRFGPRIWHNSGALGMPANDGTQRVWYSLMLPSDGDIVFRHIPLAYDHAATKARMAYAGLPAGYTQAVGTGLWPSLSVLPEAEKARTGIAIGIDDVVAGPELAAPAS